MFEPLVFEQLTVGQRWKTQGRTVTETDIINFAGLTGDYDPLHVDHESAAETPYGRPIAHGLLGLSYLAGLASTCPRVQTLAFVTIRDWQFRRPIYRGDTITAESEIVALYERGRRSGEVTWRRRLLNQRDEITQEGEFVTLVARRDPRQRAAAGATLRVDAAHPASPIPPSVTKNVAGEGSAPSAVPKP